MTREWMRESVIADWTQATGATAASGAIVDTDGYESVLLLGKLETTSTAAHLTMQMGTATDDMSQATGDASGIAPNLFLEVFRPIKRYVQGTVWASAGAQNVGVLTILKGSRKQPTSNATTVAGKFLQSPGSGTATG